MPDSSKHKWLPNNRWVHGWRGAFLGAILGTLVSALLFVVPEKVHGQQLCTNDYEVTCNKRDSIDYNKARSRATTSVR